MNWNFYLVVLWSSDECRNMFFKFDSDRSFNGYFNWVWDLFLYWVWDFFGDWIGNVIRNLHWNLHFFFMINSTGNVIWDINGYLNFLNNWIWDLFLMNDWVWFVNIVRYWAIYLNMDWIVLNLFIIKNKI